MSDGPGAAGAPAPSSNDAGALARDAWIRAQAARDAGHLETASRWTERAHRLLPDDALLQLTLGALRLEQGDADGARPLLEAVAHEQDVAEAWLALAACLLALGAATDCVAALERALQASVVTPAMADLADCVAQRFAVAGWCGLGADGRLRFGRTHPTSIRLEGRDLDPAASVPAGSAIDVDGEGGSFVGSPLPVGRLRAVLGFVAAADGGLIGWAWHPADADRDPVLTISGPLGRFTLTADAPAEGVDDLNLLARPRRIAVSATALAGLGAPVAVTDATGRHLLGSPLEPDLERMGGPRFLPRWVDGVGRAPAVDRADRAVDVVIPVFGGGDGTLACVETVLATVPAGTAVHVVDDASPEPALRDALDALAGSDRIRLHRHATNRGFPAAANTGFSAAAGRDVVLLNSDVTVPSGWLERLRRAAYASPENGTATPLSNDGSVVSYPAPGKPAPAPDAAGLARLDAWAQTALAGQTAALPVGVGFCLFVRRDCLDQAGPFRTDLFAQGYGEETDLCLRARRFGWRHVAALDVFVAHVGGRSFGRGREHLQRRNQTVLNRLHPGYDALVAAHLAADPLFAARRRMDALRWAAERQAGGAVVLVTHDEGGGVAELVASRAASVRAEAARAVVLRPAPGGCRIDGFENLRFAVPSELPMLAALLRDDRPYRMEVHHLLGHQHGVLDLARLLAIPIETWIHDASSFCPRIALIGRERRYCGEPAVADCVDCVADLGSYLPEAITAPDLLARSAAQLGASDRVVAPTQDGARRLRRHFPAIDPVVVPWKDDGMLPPLDPAPARATVRVCVVGAIGVEKGFDVLLGCVRDAGRRALPLEFVVCGYTEDDARLLAAGPVFVTGRYAPAAAVALIRAQLAHLAFIPSIWPETWCFALSRAWEAGLAAVAFDLGAQAERVRATGRGHTLPLGLPPGRINDALLRLASVTSALQP